jgi:uncharacterized membrane protein
MRPPDPARSSPALRTARRLLGDFSAGFIALAPILITVLILDWLVRTLIGAVGPDSLTGQALIAIGSSLSGGRPLLGYAIGVAALVAGITLLGAFVQRQARDAFASALDSLLGRLPLFGRVYRPMAQLVRTMTGESQAEMSAMRAVVIHFGAGIESIGFLTSSKTFDTGQGPAMMVLVPTAPVPFGGALMLVPVDRLRTIPGVDFEETAKLYVTMGTVAPEQIVAPTPVMPATVAPLAAPPPPPPPGT